MKIEEIGDKIDYNNLMNSYKMSSAPLEIREEAIRKLKATYPEYDVEVTDTREVMKTILECQADIPKMD